MTCKCETNTVFFNKKKVTKKHINLTFIIKKYHFLNKTVGGELLFKFL